MASIAPNNQPHWNQQKVLETVRGLKDISMEQKTALEQMLQSENTKIASAISASATLQDLEKSLLEIAKQIATASGERYEFFVQIVLQSEGSCAAFFSTQKPTGNRRSRRVVYTQA
jgi:hypothetical protein